MYVYPIRIENGLEVLQGVDAAHSIVIAMASHFRYVHAAKIAHRDR